MNISLPIAFLFWLLAYGAGYANARSIYSKQSSVPPRDPDSISDAEIMAEHRAGHRIEALRLYRLRYGCGLKQAQEGLRVLAASMADP